jgi:hypothetical protein
MIGEAALDHQIVIPLRIVLFPAGYFLTHVGGDNF